MNANEEKEVTELVDKHVTQLMEHFDSVQILASRQSPSGSTVGVKRGEGNWYARRGLAQEFVEMDQANNMEQARTDEDEGNEARTG